MSAPTLNRSKKHDHRRSLWVMAGGHLLWCYRCGAVRTANKGDGWIKPTGPNGKNPAMKDQF